MYDDAQAPLVEHDEYCVNNKELQKDPKIGRGALSGSLSGYGGTVLCMQSRWGDACPAMLVTQILIIDKTAGEPHEFHSASSRTTAFRVHMLRVWLTCELQTAVWCDSASCRGLPTGGLDSGRLPSEVRGILSR